jgi:hypothetical protein
MGHKDQLVSPRGLNLPMEKKEKRLLCDLEPVEGQGGFTKRWRLAMLNLRPIRLPLLYHRQAESLSITLTPCRTKDCFIIISLSSQLIPKNGRRRGDTRLCSSLIVYAPLSVYSSALSKASYLTSYVYSLSTHHEATEVDL